MADDFGVKAPGWIWQQMIRACHKPDGSIISRMLAPLVRKAIVHRPSMLPVDVSLDGLNLRCRFVDNYSEKKFVFTPWRYDQRERGFLSQKLENGGVFIDIGANVGLYTLSAARAMWGKAGRIIAFEPNPETLERLNFNLRANTQLLEGVTEVTVLNLGVADRDTTLTLHVDGSNLGSGSIARKNRFKPESHNREVKTVSVHCRPLLDVLQEHAVHAVDVLKIDIEGAEDVALVPFLENAPGSLLPGSLLVENSSHLWERDLFGLIKQKGYHRVFQTKLNTVFSLREGGG